MTTRSAAILTIKRPADMTARGRTRLVAWLRRQATFLSRHHAQMASRFTARYLYR